MKILKYVFVVITTLIVICAMAPSAEAATTVKNFDAIRSDILNWMNVGKSGNTGIDEGALKSIIAPVVNVLTAIGIFTIVIVTIIMGIKYMFAEANEMAKLKEQLIRTSSISGCNFRSNSYLEDCVYSFNTNKIIK